MTVVVRRAHGYFTDVVDITWTYADGSTFTERRTAPPQPTVDARRNNSGIIHVEKDDPKGLD